MQRQSWLGPVYVLTIHECVHAKSLQSCHNSLQPYRLQPARLFCPCDSPGKNTGVGCPAVFQGIFLTQESNPHSYVSCIGWWVLYHWHLLGSPTIKMYTYNNIHIMMSWYDHLSFFFFFPLTKFYSFSLIKKGPEFLNYFFGHLFRSLNSFNHLIS